MRILELHMSPAPKKGVEYLPCSPISHEGIWDEQYAYLRIHAENCRVDACEHCWRMNRVKEVLMMPFRKEREYAIEIAKRKAKGAGK